VVKLQLLLAMVRMQPGAAASETQGYITKARCAASEVHQLWLLVARVGSASPPLTASLPQHLAAAMTEFTLVFSKSAKTITCG
jgi:hypothetical protein